MIKSPNLGFYILDEHGNPQKTRDIEEWAKWYQTADRSIAETMIGTIRVSTVFLALDHKLKNSPSDWNYEPILYETMIFGGDNDSDQWRWFSKAEALEGHKKIVEDLTATTLN